MAEQPHWRKIRAISLPSEDNRRLERLREKAESVGRVINPTVSHVVRAALRELERLPAWKFRQAIEAIPATRYGPESKNPRPTLSEEERDKLLQKFGLK